MSTETQTEVLWGVPNLGKFLSTEKVSVHTASGNFVGYIVGVSPRNITFKDEEDIYFYIITSHITAIRRLPVKKKKKKKEKD